MSALERCVGDVRDFLDRSWARRPHLRVTGSGPGGSFDDLLTLEDVDRLISSTSLRTPLFRLVKGGKPLPVSSYTRSASIGGAPLTGVADPARVFQAVEDGATLVLQGLHRFWPPLSRFVRELELTLGHDCQVNAYLTPPGSQGLGVHEDAHDVFVLQAFGRKHWEVHASPAETADHSAGASAGPGSDPGSGLPGGMPRHVVLETGSTLYLPKGTPHAARTQDVLSGHLTVGVLATTWRRVLDRLLARLQDDPTLDEPLPAGYHRDPEGFAALVAERIPELGRRLDKLDPYEVGRAVSGAVTDRFLTTRPPLLRGGLLDRLRLADLDDETLVRRRPLSVCELRSGTGDQPGRQRLRVLLGDRELRLPGWVEPTMRRLAETPDGGEWRPRDLGDVLDPESRLVLVRRLVREGLLEVADGA